MANKDWKNKIKEMKKMHEEVPEPDEVKKKVKEWANYFDPLVATALWDDEVCDTGSTIPED